VNNLDPAQYPTSFFIFVNQASATTYNNFNRTGQFCSAGMAAAPAPADWPNLQAGKFDFLPLLPNSNAVGFLSPFVHNLINEYTVEYDAEMYRRQHVPDAPSRLSAVYAFGSMSDCTAAAQKHQWPLAEVREFILTPHPATFVRRVNMEIVSLGREVYPHASWGPAEKDYIWGSYWQGSAGIDLDIPDVTLTKRQKLSSGYIWEYLIEGCLQKV